METRDQAYPMVSALLPTRPGNWVWRLRCSNLAVSPISLQDVRLLVPTIGNEFHGTDPKTIVVVVDTREL
jgi:hypothetical protein